MEAKWKTDNEFYLCTKEKIYEVQAQRTLRRTKRFTWYKIVNDMEETCGFQSGYCDIMEEQ